ncbi:hypothetical protein INF27_05210 [Bifidobacterium saeculare]|uniref:PmeII family type II restriction endonuclease n=1 Tax=Bifidobacterium pullorum TaxID=78448 RepID=UPI001876F22E|nr:PmeII family type II restriction endonuclease [Bifidobacterium pullorum]MBE5065419.1 hypothetical protein [Bifidobacterium pullorum subsp. saeculare]MDM8323367.1 PmeII family type II restriction endonuclease [Bifidobacterium pullorum]
MGDDSLSMATSREDRVRQSIAEYIDRRLEWYSQCSYRQLLGKDFAIFAARGVTTAEEYVVEAFHALESSSEETMIGSMWQKVIAAISADTIDSGDLTTVRDGAVYVCELKAQANTTNSSSFPQELRGLRQRMSEIAGRRRASAQPVKAALCITRDWKSVDEVRTFTASDVVRENRDLDGFEYRYLSGAAMWRWLCGVDSQYGLLQPLSALETETVKIARERTIIRLQTELLHALRERDLGTGIDDVVTLSERLNEERNRKYRQRRKR